MTEPILCDCNHPPADHEDGDGRCHALDSYNQPCECPSYSEVAFVEDVEH